jgi:Leucine-rich repeat (LRR) protein
MSLRSVCNSRIGLPLTASVEGLREHKNLRTLDLSGCDSLTSVEGLRELKNLRMLDLSGCDNLTSVEDLKELS